MRSSHRVRWIVIAATACTVIGAAIACGTDKNGTAPSDDDAGQSVGKPSDAGLPTESGDGAADSGECTEPDGGVGKTCAESKDCTCGNVCAALRCVPKSKCDEALLAWEGPTPTPDGSCAPDYTGFTVRWGHDAGGPYTESTDAGLPCTVLKQMPCGGADAGTTAPQLTCAYRVKSLMNGTWYFTAVTYNDAGLESVPSNETMITIACP